MFRQCSARPMVTVANYGVGCTKSHCLAAEANLCEWLLTAVLSSTLGEFQNHDLFIMITTL